MPVTPAASVETLRSGPKDTETRRAVVRLRSYRGAPLASRIVVVATVIVGGVSPIGAGHVCACCQQSDGKDGEEGGGQSHHGTLHSTRPKDEELKLP